MTSVKPVSASMARMNWIYSGFGRTYFEFAADSSIFPLNKGLMKTQLTSGSLKAVEAVLSGV